MTDLHKCISLLAELVACHSESQREEPAALFLARYLEQMGLNTELQYVENQTVNVIGRLQCGNRKKRLYLGGHIDTVKAGEGWDYDPFSLTVEGERIYGLGAGDMKGGLAAQITVVQRLIEEGFGFNGEIVLLGLADEERYSEGAKHFLRQEAARLQGLPQKDLFAILGEPHYDEIVIGAAGKILLELSLTGQSGHAARPESGVNAIEEAARLLTAITKEYGPAYQNGHRGSFCTLKIASDYAGYNLSIPDRCTVLFNKQLMIGEDAGLFISELPRLYTEAGGRGQLNVAKIPPCYDAYKLSEQLPQILALERVFREIRQSSPAYGVMQSASDANLLAPAGIPTVLFGPQGVNIHQKNEYVTQTSLAVYMQILYHYIRDYFTEIK